MSGSISRRRLRVYDEGVLLPPLDLNFTGSGITVAESGGKLGAAVSAGAGSYSGTVFTATGGNDTAALQAILDGFESVGGGELIISGMCKVTGLRYDGGNLTIRGAHASAERDTGGCGFINTSTATTTLDFSHNIIGNPDGAASDQNHLIENLRFTADNAMTGGWAIRGGTTFSEAEIRNCTFNGGNGYGGGTGHHSGIYIGDGCQNVRISHCFIWYMIGTCVEFQGFETGNAAGEGTTYQIVGGLMALSNTGLKWKHRDAVRCFGVDFVLNLFNVKIEADTSVPQGYGNIQIWGCFVGCTFDAGTVMIVGHALNRISHVHFDNCIFLSGGLYLSVNVYNTKVNGCTFMNGAGVSVAAGVVHTSIADCTFTDVNTAVTIASTVCDFEIIGNKHYRTTATNNLVLVAYGGSNDRFIVANNSIKSNTPGTASVSSGTPGGSNTITTPNLAVVV